MVAWPDGCARKEREPYGEKTAAALPISRVL